jgi:hypothetical protein
MNVEKYVVNGKVRRSVIATDVKNGHLSKEEVVYLCSLPEVQASFIETGFVPKKSEKEWNANYLEELSCAAIAEVFNQDYLLHLKEVSDLLNKKQQRLKIVMGICIGLSLLCLAIAIIAFLI